MTDLHSRGESSAARLRHPSAGDGIVRRRPINFYALLVLTVALSLMGLVMVLSASTVAGLDEQGSTWFYFKRQIMFSVAGLVAMVVLARLDYRRLRQVAPLSLVLCLGALIAVLIPGVGISANGSTRWIGVGAFTIQPAEFAKLGLALAVAALLARRSAHMHDPQLTERPVLILAGVTSLLVLFQPSQGTAMVIAAVAVIMLYFAGAPIRRLLVIAATAAVAAFFLAMRESYRWARVQAVLDPWEDPTNTGFQTIQSFVGIASGGVTGVGLGAGRAKWGFLPFAHTDFIFAVIAEELGLIGAALVILLFIGLAFFGAKAALDAPDIFGGLLAAGITTWIALQAFINIGAVVGVLPISGVTLPFISVGGSSLIVTMAAMGIVLSVARQGRPAPARGGHT